MEGPDRAALVRGRPGRPLGRRDRRGAASRPSPGLPGRAARRLADRRAARGRGRPSPDPDPGRRPAAGPAPGGWDPPPRLVLCVGPHARYADVERWSRLVNVVIPEATAPETVARHALGRPTGPGRRRPRPRVAVVSTDHELRTTLAEACRSGGLRGRGGGRLGRRPPRGRRAWDVPALEPDWPARLAGPGAVAPVVALLGFADRSTVAVAREHGASACLDLRSTCRT